MEVNKYHKTAAKLHQIAPKVPIDINHILATFTDIKLEYVRQITNDIPLVDRNDETYTFITVHNPTSAERFMIAKHLAHLLFGHVDNYPNLYRRQANELQLSANRLAASILIPKEHIQEQIEKMSETGDIIDLPQLSELYNVEIHVIATYIKDMGLNILERN
jgi:hypothetical protein